MSIEYTSRGEIWRTDIPPAVYHSLPVAEAYDADELMRDAQGIGRLLAGCELQVSRLLDTPVSLATLVGLADVATVTDHLPTEAVRQAREMLKRLELALGPAGWCHDCSGPAHPGTDGIPMQQIRERVAVLEQQIARITAAFTRPASPGRRGNA
jgi:hypothetical protein